MIFAAYSYVQIFTRQIKSSGDKRYINVNVVLQGLLYTDMELQRLKVESRQMVFVNFTSFMLLLLITPSGIPGAQRPAFTAVKKLLYGFSAGLLSLRVGARVNDDQL